CGGITPFVQLESGHFAGSFATHAGGDTLLLVFNDKDGSDPAAASWIKFMRSLDGGATWQTINVCQVSDCLTRPTLQYYPDEILIAYTDGTRRLAARSIDGGSTWQTADTVPALDLGRSFENSPVVERRNGEIKLFSLELPYPEYAQDQYTMPDDPDALMDHQIYIENDISSTDTPMLWFGIHVFDGIVRANSDIRIKQAGGGDNNGWPTFNAPVIIGGEVISMSGPYPHDEVFRGGLIEHAPAMRSNDYFGHQDSTPLLTGYEGSETIVYVDVNGSTYTALLGILMDPRRVFADVYAPYPPPQGYPLWRNQYSLRDTSWVFLGSGTCSDRTMYVNGKLWIKGTFATNQVWVASDTIFVIGDILLSGTPAGSSPATNTVDSVRLISEKSVLMKYGYSVPIDSLRYHIARPDSEPFQIYADIFAFGKGDDNPRADGTFSFEYQHPHPSVPAYRLGNTTYPRIDLHRRRYPQNATNPWPPEIDYPWYNPLWPERTPYLERGKIWLWGSVNQTR
ncbi:MAG: hypothetical protein U1B83_08620, partial [Candidatus Cloacimonadaceae bacterium]|nr:hypothetical protein [Candidatus Cloacimonadaceae bacterium]